jgi:hypothetical protein
MVFGMQMNALERLLSSASQPATAVNVVLPTGLAVLEH